MKISSFVYIYIDIYNLLLLLLFKKKLCRSCQGATVVRKKGASELLSSLPITCPYCKIHGPLSFHSGRSTCLNPSLPQRVSKFTHMLQQINWWWLVTLLLAQWNHNLKKWFLISWKCGPTTDGILFGCQLPLVVVSSPQNDKFLFKCVWLKQKDEGAVSGMEGPVHEVGAKCVAWVFRTAPLQCPPYLGTKKW